MQLEQLQDSILLKTVAWNILTRMCLLYQILRLVLKILLLFAFKVIIFVCRKKK